MIKEQLLYHAKSTSGTHVYSCAPTEMAKAVVTSLYIKKTAFPDSNQPPTSIKLTIESIPG